MPSRALSIHDGSFPAAASILDFAPRERGVRVTGRDAAQRQSSRLVQVVLEAQRGSKRAFSKLWKRYAPTVHGILLTMVPEPDADDLCQDVAIAALRALPGLNKPESFPTWLNTIARNLGRDALKRQRESKTAPLVDALAVAAPPAGDATEASEILDQIRTLPECHREPMMLRLLLGMSGPEIAEEIGMTEGSVRVNLCRGMKLLRERLEHWT